MRMFAAAVLLGSATALAGPGDLDVSFGRGGWATLPPGPVADRATEAGFVNSDPEGRILAIGSILQPTDGPEGPVPIFARFLADGKPDASLAGTGYLHPELRPDTSRLGRMAFPVAGGRTLLVEERLTLCWPPRPACALATDLPYFFAQRIDAGGAIDPAYGVMATVSMDIQQQDVVASPDGSLTVVGYQYPPRADFTPGDPVFDVRGVDPAGQLFTPWFGARAAYDCGEEPRPMPGNAKIARQADGKFLIAQQVASNTWGQACVSRVNPDATLDTSYGTGGRFRLAELRLGGFGPPFIVAAIARHGGGALLVLKVPLLSEARTYLVWLTQDGALDTARGNGGIAGPITSPIFDVRAVALQPDGKIVMAGYPERVATAKIPPPTPVDLGRPRIVRLDAWGVPDPGFGRTGEGYAPLTSVGRSLLPRHIHVAGDGAIFVAGNLAEAGAPGQGRFAIAKLEGDPPPPSSSRGGGGGCFSIRIDRGPFDPTLPVLALAAALLLVSRSRRRP